MKLVLCYMRGTNDTCDTCGTRDTHDTRGTHDTLTHMTTHVTGGGEGAAQAAEGGGGGSATPPAAAYRGGQASGGTGGVVCLRARLDAPLNPVSYLGKVAVPATKSVYMFPNPLLQSFWANSAFFRQNSSWSSFLGSKASNSSPTGHY